MSVCSKLISSDISSVGNATPIDRCHTFVPDPHQSTDAIHLFQTHTNRRMPYICSRPTPIDRCSTDAIHLFQTHTNRRMPYICSRPTPIDRCHTFVPDPHQSTDAIICSRPTPIDRCHTFVPDPHQSTDAIHLFQTHTCFPRFAEH